MKPRLTKGFIGIASLEISSLLLVVRNAYIENMSFDHTLIPWFGASLYQVQRFGITVASILFPCETEGFDTGCEWFKVVPTILLVNAFVYFVVLTPMIHIYAALKSRRSSYPSA